MDKATRPEWDEYFLDIAAAVGRRATCLRRRYGAIIVKDKIAKGIVLEDDTEVMADYVIANASPYNVLTKMIDGAEIPKFQTQANTTTLKSVMVRLTTDASPITTVATFQPTSSSS